MNRRINIFLFFVISSLCIIPLVNVISTPNLSTVKWWHKTFLYKMDFAATWAAKLLYPFGISTKPEEVLIGYDDWLYLGHNNEQTLMFENRPPTAADIETGVKIRAAMTAWDVYLSSKGVQLFKIMMAPDKGSIYPEHLPTWARPVPFNTTDALLGQTGSTPYIDFRGALLAAKEDHPEALYYKTDTHWNSLGASVAFRAFSELAGAAMPGILWPSGDTYDVTRVVPRRGGDLASLMRLSADLTDAEPWIFVTQRPLETTRSDFDTGKVIHRGGNPEVYASNKPLLVQSDGALNKKKVLWLRDSFGTAMSPLMAATFSDVLHLHWHEAMKPGGRLLKLVGQWNPDFVFVTVVERASRSDLFTGFPPQLFIPVTEDFKASLSTTPVSSNHLPPGPTKDTYKVNGNDPFVDFLLPHAVSPSDVRYLEIDLTCADGTPMVPLRLSWAEDNRPLFDKKHSARISFPTGRNLVDLLTIRNWGMTDSIGRLRLHIDAQNSCAQFKLSKVAFAGNHIGFDRER